MTQHENTQGEFIVKIIDTLNKNGFPEKKVSLPLEKLYESAHAKGINFNRILEFLSEKEDIHHEKEGDRIIFSKGAPQPATGFMPGMDAFKNMDMGMLMQQAQEMMKQMSPEQIAEAQNMVKNMSPDQVSKFQDMFSNMSPEQIRDLKEKADKFIKKD